MSDAVLNAISVLMDRVSELTEVVRRLEAGEQYRVRFEKLGYTIVEASKIMNIGQNELRAMVKAGRIRSVCCGETGRKRIIHLSAIADFMEGREGPHDDIE
jgi:excisionase family DNA binding protein